jgi:hypothetical protein
MMHDANATTVPPEVEASYATIIDTILAASDLTTISAKAIRKGLQKAVNYDIGPQKVSCIFNWCLHSLLTVSLVVGSYQHLDHESVR